MDDEKLYDLGLRDSDRVASEFGGGIPKGSITLIEGVDGAGKSVFSQRFAHGICSVENEEGDKKYSASYITPELKLKDFLQQTQSLSYDVLDQIITEQNLLFLHANVNSRQRLHTKSSDSRPLLSRLTEDTNSVIWDNDVIFIDGFDGILRNDPEFDEASSDEKEIYMENFTDYVSSVISDGRSVVITVNHESIGQSVLQSLRSISDIYLRMNVNEKAGGVRRNITVRRYAKRGSDVNDVISFRVQAGIGIVIETRTVT